MKIKASMCVIANSREQVLILRRSKTDKWKPHYWCLPGGTLEKGETPEEGLIREVKEESNLDILYSYSHKKIRPKRNMELYYFFCDDYEGRVKLSFEHDDFAWVGRRSFDKYKFVPNAKDIIEECFKKWI